jgi:hypothetical protein
LSPPIQECQPDSYELSTALNPLLSEAEAARTAEASVVSKASARVNVVEPLEATGICAVWSMCPLLETPEYVVVRA